ncbi:MAG: hypothetical protein KAU58_03160 [Candidatus Omnitrophica bacterium]|nr:hypothetical protein [Candidatus Omnitrophota bacterium]
MEKVKYGIDPHNKLIIEETKRKTKLPGFRRILDGKFKVNKNNTLIYHIKSPLPHDINAPHQVKLRGRWSLTENHSLRFTLDKWRRQTFGDQLILRGDITDVNKNSVEFSVTTTTKDNVRSTHVLKLRGRWQADKHNRLIFMVKKEHQRYDTLTFNGAWQINKNHEIIYQYQKARLIRKLKKIHTLTLKGYWDIKEKMRVSYVIDRNTNSAFDFRTRLAIFKDDYIKYAIGIKLSRRPGPVKQTITLFGRWKVKKNVGLVFEVKYGNRKIQKIVFGAEVKITNRDTILFKLKNNVDNEDIGIKLELGHKILKGDGQAFIRLLKSKRESVVLIGAGLKW